MSHEERNFIVQTVKKIDKVQKEVCFEEEERCNPCDKSLIKKQFDTIPVSFFSCSGSPFEAFLEPGNEMEKTSLFRIECIRDCRFVTLRLIERKEVNCKVKLKCTDLTCILDLECVCCIQCFDPIDCRCK